MTQDETLSYTDFPFLAPRFPPVHVPLTGDAPQIPKELRQFPGDQRLPCARGSMQQHAPDVADPQVTDHVGREDPGCEGAPEDVAELPPWW